jgi:hypothetical protein
VRARLSARGGAGTRATRSRPDARRVASVYLPSVIQTAPGDGLFIEGWCDVT